MFTYDYIIIGGGVAGIAALDELLAIGATSNILLLEARSEIGYTLTWMDTVSYPSRRFGREFTGAEFRSFLMGQKDSPRNKHILFRSRAFSLDLDRGIVHYLSADKKRERLAFKHLICAPGAVQILYGRKLLPGQRTARLYTTYQVGEMLTHYPFYPGKKLIVYGSTPYSIELANLAHSKNLPVTLVSPAALNSERKFLDTEIPAFESSKLIELQGDTMLDGIKIVNTEGEERLISGDSLAVDGDFVLEHQWRDQLKIEWDLQNWQVSDNSLSDRAEQLSMIGDAYKPMHSFIQQYEHVRDSIREKQLIGNKA